MFLSMFLLSEHTYGCIGGGGAGGGGGGGGGGGSRLHGLVTEQQAVEFPKVQYRLLSPLCSQSKIIFLYIYTPLSFIVIENFLCILL